MIPAAAQFSYSASFRATKMKPVWATILCAGRMLMPEISHSRIKSSCIPVMLKPPILDMRFASLNT